MSFTRRVIHSRFPRSVLNSRNIHREFLETGGFLGSHGALSDTMTAHYAMISDSNNNKHKLLLQPTSRLLFTMIVSLSSSSLLLFDSMKFAGHLNYSSIDLLVWSVENLSSTHFCMCAAEPYATHPPLNYDFLIFKVLGFPITATECVLGVMVSNDESYHALSSLSLAGQATVFFFILSSAKWWCFYLFSWSSGGVGIKKLFNIYVIVK